MTKLGVQSTEFWITVIGKLWVIYEAFAGNLPPQIAAIVLTILVTVYVIARAFVKIFGPMLDSKADAPTLPTITGFALLVLCLLIPFTTASCGHTEKNRIAQNYAINSAAADSIGSMLDAKQISISTAEKLFTLLNAEQAAVEAWDDARATGDKDLIQKTGSAALAAIKSFNTAYNKAQSDAAALKAQSRSIRVD